MKYFWCLFSAVFLNRFCSFYATPCDLRAFSHGIVCVCNATYCDSLDDLMPVNNDNLIIVSSTKGGLRFDVRYERFVSNDIGKRIIRTRINNRFKNDEQTDSDRTIWPIQGSATTKATVTVNRNKTYQKIVGFGGAFTGTVSHLLNGMVQPLQDALYKSYYSLDSGIGFNMMRIPIGGCDFDLNPWAYNESPVDDMQLSNFVALDQRDLDRIKQIRQLKEVARNYDIKFVGAAWSPPIWMKTNKAWSGASALEPKYYRTWAEYHLRYLELMAKENVNFWAISTGNEPLNGVIGWIFVHFMSLGWTAANQGVWVGDHMGPLLRNSSFSDVKLLGSDDQRYVYPWWFEQMEAAHSESVKYLDGFAVHWYWDGIVPPTLLDQTHERFTNKLILNTESCIGDKPWQVHGPVLGAWDRAEKYITAFIEDLEHWVNGWVDWNLVLDLDGGPNYVKNHVDAPIIVNIDAGEFYKQPMFYAIGHFSRFILPDSIRMEVTTSHRDIKAIGFQRPDDSVALILFSKSSRPINVTISDGKRHFELMIPPSSIHTMIYL